MDELEKLYHEHGIEVTTKPFDHQRTGFFLSLGKEYFAQLGEQGTGKTWIFIAEAAMMYQQGLIDRVLVLAPKGVDANWMIDQIPTHMPSGIDYKMALWRAGAGTKMRLALAQLVDAPTVPFAFDAVKDKSRKMKWLLMNWDAISTQKGFSFAMNFLEDQKVLVICDEAQKVKSPSTARAKALMKMKQFATYRRIGTGTPVSNSPFDLFVPFSFLSVKILQETSFTVFKSTYAKMAGSQSPMYQAMFKKMAAPLLAQGMDPEKVQRMIQYRVPKLIEKDADGKKIYKNLDQLRDLIAPHSYRVLKKDCLDLPEKLYKNIYFELTETQEKIYDEVRDKLRLIFAEDIIQPLSAMTALNKLAQITSGFYIETMEGVTHRIPGINPKIEAIKEALEEIDGKVIIWAQRRAEMEDIKHAAREMGMPLVEYHGGVNDRDRKISLDRYENGDAKIFLGHPKSGGTGLTLIAGSNVFYYSNSFSMEERKQSEDRAHRIGQRRNVTYWDFIARDTVEQKIVKALQDKTDLAALINGDLLRPEP